MTAWTTAPGGGLGSSSISAVAGGTEGSSQAQLLVNSQGLSYSGQSAFTNLLRSSTFSAQTGEIVSVDWRVTRNQDSAIAYGFLRRAADNAIVGNFFSGTYGATTSWATATAAAPEAGDYYLEFQGGSSDASGDRQVGAALYIDNVRTTVVPIPPVPPINVRLTLEGYENPHVSCPWIMAWDGSQFVQDNDVYSTARGAAQEYRDYYTLRNPLVASGNQYLLQLAELDNENSWTDRLQLVVVDHAAGTKIAVDANGQIVSYANPLAPAGAVDDAGNNVRSQLLAGGAGFSAYNDDSVVLDFSNVDTSTGARLVFSIKGFVDDGTELTNLPAPARVFVQTENDAGNWITQYTFNPRMDWDTVAADLSGKLGADKRVRLLASSCVSSKYHLIANVGLEGGTQTPVSVTALDPREAVRSDGVDVLPQLTGSDNIYATLSPGSRINLKFDQPAQAGDIRDFIIASEGYYVPAGTYKVYTPSGGGWSERYAASFIANYPNDTVQTFDLSAYLPQSGEYKVRIFQTYTGTYNSQAAIDFVGLSGTGTPGVMLYATELKNNTSVLSQLSSSNDVRYGWASNATGEYRWIEVAWSLGQPPTYTAPSNQAALEGNSTMFDLGSFADVDGGPWQIDVNWGDGSPVSTFGAVASGPLQASHTFTEQGIRNVTVSVKDSTNQTSSGAFQINIANQPTVAAGTSLTVIKGTPFTLPVATFSDPGGSEPEAADPPGSPISDHYTATIDWGDGTAPSAGVITYYSTTRVFTVAGTHTYANDGWRSVVVTIDHHGVISTATSPAAVGNVAPYNVQLNTGVVNENDLFTLNGSFLDPGLTDTHTVVINWGDGSPATNLNLAAGVLSFSTSHRYLDDNPTGTPGDNYAISVTVTDDGGLSDAGATIVTVNNLPPEITEFQVPVFYEGNTATARGKISDTGSLDTHTVTILWGDGASSTVAVDPLTREFQATHQYLDDNPTTTPSDTYPILATVTDDDTASAPVSTTATVNNVAPTVFTEGDETIGPESLGLFTCDGSFTDPGTDTWWATVDYGDGSGVQPLALSGKTFQLSHTYLNSAPYLVTVTVGDDDSAVKVTTFTVTVDLNRDPTAVAGGPYTVGEGGLVALSGAGSSDPDELLGDSIVSYEWDFNYNGVSFEVDATGVNPMFSAATLDGPTSRTIALRVMDSFGATSTLSQSTVFVTNVAPTILPPIGPSAGVRAKPLAFTGSFADPGTLDTFQVAWNFGDGSSIALHSSTDAGALTPTHAYANNGLYTVTFTVIDKDGGVDVRTQQLAITPTVVDKGVLYVGGTPNNDYINISPCQGTSVFFAIARLYASYSGITKVVVFGGDGHDYIDVTADYPKEAELWGGTGNDSILGGMAGDVLMGEEGDDRLDSRGGADILIGGNGADRARGGIDRDLLIAGTGFDSLYGDAGEDILVASASTLDSNLPALKLIRAEWNSSRSYAVRTANIRTGTGSGDRVNGSAFLRDGVTVFDDNTPDWLTGGYDAFTDWFFADRSAGDLIMDPGVGETVDVLFS